MTVRTLRVTAVLAAGLVAAAVGGGQPAVSALAAPAKAPQRAATAWLNGVSATSTGNVWAVGGFGHADGTAPLIEHWNGHTWSATKPFLNQVENADYYAGVSATSASAAVSAGVLSDQYGLLLGAHWNGRKWTQDFMPIIGPDDGTADISAVASVQGGPSWSVGAYYGGPDDTAQAQLTMILRWNASTREWVQVTSPSPGGDGNGAHSVLNAVATDSRTDAWAVGGSSTGGTSPVTTLIEHWNGASWTVVPSPNPGQPGCADDELLGVTASAAGTWAVGKACGKAVVLQLTAGQWKAVSTPAAPKGDHEQLSAVAVASASNAWAVGQVGTRPLILHWNGTRWGKPGIAIPAGASSAQFSGVTAVSANAAWAVGKANYPGSKTRMLIEKWNGTKWALVTIQNPIP